MLSKKFFGWMGIGVVFAIAIPVLAAPILTKHIQSRPASAIAKPKPAKPAPAKPAKPTSPAAAASKPASPTKPATQVAGKIKPSTPALSLRPKAPVMKKTRVAAKPIPRPAPTLPKTSATPALRSKSVTAPAIGNATTAAIARKLLH